MVVVAEHSLTGDGQQYLTSTFFVWFTSTCYNTCPVLCVLDLCQSAAAAAAAA